MNMFKKYVEWSEKRLRCGLKWVPFGQKWVHVLARYGYTLWSEMGMPLGQKRVYLLARKGYTFGQERVYLLAKKRYSRLIPTCRWGQRRRSQKRGPKGVSGGQQGVLLTTCGSPGVYPLPMLAEKSAPQRWITLETACLQPSRRNFRPERYALSMSKDDVRRVQPSKTLFIAARSFC